MGFAVTNGGFLSLILRRILEALVSLITLCALTFFLLKFWPGGPFDDESPLNPLVKKNLEDTWALNQGLGAQALAYLKSLASGNLGWSMTQPGQSVGEIIGEGLSQTLSLNLFSLLVVFILGFAIALALNLKPGTWLEKFLNAFILACISLPSLFLGPLLIWIFALKLDWLPVAFLDNPLSYILPVVTLSLRPTASVARILNSALKEAQTTDYMRTAHAKGLSAFQALRKHALRNSILPLLGYAGTLIVGLFSGSFIVEILFSVKGLGAAFVFAIENRDETVILGLAIFYGFLLIVISALLDVLILMADPRLREEKR